MDRCDELIVWDQYGTYVAADGRGRQLFSPSSQTQLFRSFWHASPDGSSGALGGNSQGSLGAVSDPCEQQNLL